MHGCVSVLVFSIDITAFTDQQLYHPYVSLDDSQVQRGLVTVVLEVDITATLEEKNYISELLLPIWAEEQPCYSGLGPLVVVIEVFTSLMRISATSL